MASSVHYLAVGRILGAFGLRGEVKVEIHTDFPERFRPKQLLHLELDDEWQTLTIRSCRFHQGNALLLFEGYQDRTRSERLGGHWLYVPTEEAGPLEDDEFYEHEVIGARVETCEGEFLGHVQELLFTGANEVFVVSDKGKDILIPVLKDVVLEIDRLAGRVVVALPAGLRESS